MLAGLIFLGVLAAASFPDLMEGAQTDETDHPEDAEPSIETDDPTMPEDGPHEAVTAAPENGPAGDDVSQETPEDLTGDEELTGEDLFVDPEPGLVLVGSFEPGVDTLTVAVPDDAQEFTAHDSDGDSAAYLRFDTAMGTVEIRFQGLSVVPVDDLFLRVSDASSPTLDADIPLSALMDTDADEVEGPVLTPVDPEFPDDVPAPGADDPVLTPADPTLPDDPPAPGADDPTVLTPVLDDVAPTPEYDVSDVSSARGDDAGALLPSSGNDIRDIAAHDRVLVPANGDDAAPHERIMTPVSEPNDGSRGAEGPGLTPVADETGFAEQAPDVHDSRTTEGVWLYSTAGSQADVADITDFLSGEDVLRISLNPAAIASGNVYVLPSGDGADALVTIDGKVFAILRGAPEATLRDVFVETRPDLFG